MRGIDETSGEYRGPSRSRQRRDALEVLALAERLVSQTPAQLRQLPLSDTLLAQVFETRRIGSHIARKRQMAFLAKLMRREDEETLEAIRDALDAGGETARQETALLHRAETWRERLLGEGDGALAELLERHPSADRQRLRQLVRAALEERARDRPPRASRELFRLLRELLARPESGAEEPGSGPPPPP